LKFSDIIVAVASLIVVAWLVNAVLNFALIPMSTSVGGDLAFILSALVSAIIVGYVFAGKIREESRMASIGKIVVLFAVVMMLAVWTTGGATVHYSAWIDENLKNMYNTTSWANVDWFWFEMMLTMAITAVYAVYTLVFGFIGLYVGSMRKPSAKTKV
jgi:flagellar biosynthesis protein FliQ